MNYEDILKKRYLKMYRKNRALVDRLVLKLQNLDEQIYKIRTTQFTDQPKGGQPLSINELLSDKVDLERRIESLEKAGRVRKTEITRMIDTLDDPRYVTVLELFCIECLDFDTIAYEMGYTRRHCERLYREAIDNIVNDISMT